MLSRACVEHIRVVLEERRMVNLNAGKGQLILMAIRLTHSKRDISTENIHNVLALKQSTASLGL